jgi:hypothetical protein
MLRGRKTDLMKQGKHGLRDHIVNNGTRKLPKGSGGGEGGKVGFSNI